VSPYLGAVNARLVHTCVHQLHVHRLAGASRHSIPAAQAGPLSRLLPGFLQARGADQVGTADVRRVNTICRYFRDMADRG
jgi:hypothetical protein